LPASFPTRRSSGLPGPALGQAVNPSHGVGPAGLGTTIERPELVEVSEALRLDPHPGIADRHQLKLNPANQPRQAQPTDGRPEPALIILGPTLDDAAIASPQLE